jgi:hypothetical protein
MKWFKHYTDASRSEKLASLREKTGLEGYAKYWLLVELLAEKFDGNCTTFRINKKTLGIHLGYYRHTLALQWLDIGQTLGLYKFHCEDHVYVIVFDKLLEIKDNHTRNLQVTTKSVAPRKEENRIEKSKSNSKSAKPVIKSKFNIDLIYDEYPRKIGKKNGMKKLHEIIKTQESYDKIMQGIKNYKQHCSQESIETKYIKQFSTFVNGEHWEDEYASEGGSLSDADYEKMLEACVIKEDVQNEENAST